MSLSGLFRCGLSYREMLELAWQLTWPAVALDMAWSIITNVVFNVNDPTIEAAIALPFLLLVGPWLVRRMFRRHYAGFRLKTLRGGQPIEMGHSEAFKVFWLLSWRVMVPMLGLLLIASFFLRFVKVDLASLVPSSQEAPLFNAIGLSIVENAAGLFLLPLIIPGMFAKRYQGFRVAVERLSAPAVSAGTKSGDQQHAAKHQKRA